MEEKFLKIVARTRSCHRNLLYYVLIRRKVKIFEIVLEQLALLKRTGRMYRGF